MSERFKNVGIVLLMLLGWGVVAGVGVFGLGGALIAFAQPAWTPAQIALFVVAPLLAGMIPWALHGGTYGPAQNDVSWPRVVAGSIGIAGWLVGLILACIIRFSA